MKQHTQVDVAPILRLAPRDWPKLHDLVYLHSLDDDPVRIVVDADSDCFSFASREGVFRVERSYTGDGLVLFSPMANGGSFSRDGYALRWVYLEVTSGRYAWLLE